MKFTNTLPHKNKMKLLCIVFTLTLLMCSFSQVFALTYFGTPQTPDSSGNVGQHTSLAVVAGYPAISYYDYTNSALKFTRATDASGSTWGAPLTLDSDGVVGEFNSLAVVDGYPAISYFDSTNHDLKFIRATDANGSAWGTPQTLDSEGFVGRYSSLAVVNGTPAISYYDAANSALKFTRATDASGSAWDAPLTLDSNGVVGQFTSLAVVDGTPAISYSDDGDLKFIRATDASGSTWSTPQTPDSVGSVGMYTSMAVVNGTPAISYYDATNGNLKFIALQSSVDISVSDGATAINNGDSLDFSTTTLTTPVTITLTIQNNGNAALDLTTLSLPAGFSFTGSFPTKIPAGSREDINVRMEAIQTGVFTGNLLIGSTDTNQTPFSVALTGEVTQDLLETGIIAPLNGSTILNSEIQVSFNHDVLHDGSTGAANNPVNYLLVEKGDNGVFDTTTCLLGRAFDDVQQTISSVTYDDSTFTATLNTGTLTSGHYHLLVCGTTSINNLTGRKLNDGAFDSSTSFTVVSSSSSSSSTTDSSTDGTGVSGTVKLPSSGFTPGITTVIPRQSASAAYSDMNTLRLQIPDLKVDLPIVGVPQTTSGWDITWLTNAQIGWLNGTAYPTWAGNTVLTGHVTNASGNPAPFTNIKSLKFGDEITIQANGQEYIYEVRENKRVTPDNLNVVNKHEEYDWITLITCENFNENTGEYLYRRIVRAVLVDIK